MVHTTAPTPAKKKREVLERLDAQRHEFLREFTVMRRRAAMMEERALSAERRLEALKLQAGSAQTTREHDSQDAKLQALLQLNEKLHGQVAKLQTE
ncbi:hypothetical protein Gpo141_00010563 [Globisporangium polare]